MTDKGYIIFKRSIANELLEKGFRLIKVEENFYDKKKSVFIFENTQELVNYMIEIKNRKINVTE